MGCKIIPEAFRIVVNTPFILFYINEIRNYFYIFITYATGFPWLGFLRFYGLA